MKLVVGDVTAGLAYTSQGVISSVKGNIHSLQATFPILNMFLYMLLDKVYMFSASEILSLLEALEILTCWRQVFAP